MAELPAQTRAFELLVACVRGEFSPDVLPTSENVRLCESSLDWTLVVQLVRVHGITPVVSRQVRRVCPAVPPEALAYLKNQSNLNAERNLRHTKALLELLGLFQSDGIRVLAFK